MKKLVLLFILMITSSWVFCQTATVSKAEKARENGDLLEAKTLIEQALQNEKTKDKSKTWYEKGKIYTEIGIKENPLYATSADSAFDIGIKAFKKVMEIEKPNSLYYNFTELELNNLWNNLVNQGITVYDSGKVDASQYDVAIGKFKKAKAIRYDSTLAYLLALGYHSRGTYDSALIYYYKAIELGYDSEPSLYLAIIGLERFRKNEIKALEVVQQAKVKFPKDKDLPKEEINLLIATKKLDDALAKIQKEIKEDPQNPILYYNLGNLHDKLGNIDSASIYYQKAIDAKPDYLDAVWNLAALYYNRAADLLKEADKMDIKTWEKKGKALEEEAKQNFKKSLPHLTKALELSPDEILILQTLETAYSRLRMDAKADEMRARINSLKKSK